MATDLLWTGPADPVAALLLGHGAGAPMDSPWMGSIADRLGAVGIRTARFEFAYMAVRRDGVRRAAPRADLAVPELVDAVHAARAALAADGIGAPLLIGGKSYGGRVASLAADALHAAGTVAGLVCLGYPFHPPARPDQLRTAHLAELATPALICQGTRDPFGGPADVATYPLSPAVRLEWFPDGDHDLRPRTRVAGTTLAAHLDRAAATIADFARGLAT